MIPFPARPAIGAAALALLSWSLPAWGESSPGPLKATAFFTYGDYQGSPVKDHIGFQWLFIDYSLSANSGIGFSAVGNRLVPRAPRPVYNTVYTGATVFHTIPLAPDGRLGVRASVVNVKSDDANSDATNVPYGQVSWKSSGYYADFGAASAAYHKAVAVQYSLTGGVSFFDGALRSQTRVYYTTLSDTLQDRDSTLAVEERVTLAVSKQLIFSASVTPGEKMYPYLPDLNYANNSSDLQTGSANLRASYHVTPAMSLTGDVTVERYWNKPLNNSYGVTYWTIGVSYRP
ncbi:MAG: hypothetical protein HY804_04685 [Nitrospinae bacterium]|nr:hypothetical protein [Nitrospinota bacterium]